MQRAPSALAAGFPPARLAAADFGGGAGGSPVQGVRDRGGAAPPRSPRAARAADSRSGYPTDGGSTWRRAAVPAAGGVRRRAAGSSPGWRTARPAGWRWATPRRPRRATPVVLGSPDGLTWTVTGGTRPRSRAPGRIVTAAVAAGRAGYVIVGHASAGPRTVAAAWYAPGLTGWRRAADAAAGRARRPREPGDERRHRDRSRVRRGRRGRAIARPPGCRPPAGRGRW